MNVGTCSSPAPSAGPWNRAGVTQIDANGNEVHHVQGNFLLRSGYFSFAFADKLLHLAFANHLHAPVSLSLFSALLSPLPDNNRLVCFSQLSREFGGPDLELSAGMAAFCDLSVYVPNSNEFLPADGQELAIRGKG
jgi:hypothetical protein